MSSLVVTNRRGFFAGAGALVCFARDAGARVQRAEVISGGGRGDEMAAAEDYWAEIRRAFDSDRTLINLNHGGVAPAPLGGARRDDPRPAVLPTSRRRTTCGTCSSRASSRCAASCARVRLRP